MKNRGSRITHRKADLNLPQNPGNERLKRDYFESPEVVCERGYSEKSIRKDEIALLDFDAHFDYRDFRGLSKTEAITFRQSLLESDLAMPTIISKLKCVQRFLQWLSRQPGYRRKIDTQTLAYLNISKRERRAARVSRSKKFPSYEEFSQTVSKMPGEKPDELRDRAILVTLGLTGIRISALIGLKLKHFDPQRLLFHQDPTEVATKFRKEIYTFILPFDQELGEILLDWVRYLQGELGFGDDDPLFPKSVHRQGLGANFNEYTLSRQHFETTQMPEKKVKSAFEKAGFEAHTPHSLRHMIFHEAITRNWPSGVIVAISQNLGHQVPRISFQGYGQLTLVERGKLIRNAGQITDDEKNRMRMIRDVLREEEKQEKE